MYERGSSFSCCVAIVTSKRQLEKAEEEELEFVIQEEANYLQAIAREESLEICVETEPDTEVECEQGVSRAIALLLVGHHDSLLFTGRITAV